MSLEKYNNINTKKELKFNEKDLNTFTEEQLNKFNLAVANIL